ncbi:MAG: PAS domain-containing protein [Bacteroidetes bacterium]|nr:MAG: PAS domain-containing protein [Bacteroidota bacterium]TAG85601.1 MAG: PAS domain-containing protein [Bacteroidota bacterium]
MDALKTFSTEEISTETTLMEDKIVISSEEEIQEKQNLEDNIWVEANLIRLDEIIKSEHDKNITEFTTSILNNVSNTLKVVKSVFFTYIEPENILRATACFASQIENLSKKEFHLGEGLVGQAAKDMNILSLDEVEMQFDTSLGGLGKAYVLIVPLVFRQKILGVLEVMMMTKITPRTMLYVERASKNIAIGIQNHFVSQIAQKNLLQDEIKQQVYQFLEEQLNNKDNEVVQLKLKLEKKEAELEEALAHINLQEILPTQNNGETLNENNDAEKSEHYELMLSKKQTEVDILKDAVRWKDEEIEKLDNEILERKSEYRSKVESLTDEIKQLKAQLEGQNITQNDQLLEAWKERYTNIENELDQTRQELSKLRQLLQEADENYHQTKSELVQVQAKYKKREDEYIVSQYLLTQQEDTTELNRKIDQLNYIIADKESEILDFQQQLAALDSLNIVLQEKEDLKNYIDNLENALVEKDKMVLKQTETFELQSKSVEKNYLDDLTALQDEILILKNELQQKNQGNTQELEISIENKNKELNHWREQVEVLVQSVANKEKLLDQQNTNALLKIAILEQNLLDATNNNEEVANKEEVLQKRIQSLEQDIFYKNNALQAMAKLEMKLTAVEEELYAKNKENDFLQSNIKDLNEKSDNVPEVAELIAELRLKDEELTQLKTQKDTTQNEDFTEILRLKDEELTHLKAQKSNDELEFQKRLEDLELIHLHLSEKKKEMEEQANWLNEQTQKILENQSNNENKTEPKTEITENQTQIISNISVMERQKIKALDNSFISMELDIQGKILNINKPFERTLGYDLKDIETKTLNDIVDIADRSQSPFQQLFPQIQHKIIVMLNLHYEGKEGELVRLRTFFNPIENENGEVDRVLAISHYA